MELRDLRLVHSLGMYYYAGAFMLAFESVVMADESEKIFSICVIGGQVFMKLPWITSKVRTGRTPRESH
jgi:hypothetical protein